MPATVRIGSGGRTVEFRAGTMARIAVNAIRHQFYLAGGSLETDKEVVVVGDTPLADETTYHFVDFIGEGFLQNLSSSLSY
jgi:hypothetical protein